MKKSSQQKKKCIQSPVEYRVQLRSQVWIEKDYSEVSLKVGPQDSGGHLRSISVSIKKILMLVKV